MATGLPGMTFRPLGEALAAAFRDVLPHVNLTTVETEGSVRNVEFVETGKADLGLALADVAYVGFNGGVGDLKVRASRVCGAWPFCTRRRSMFWSLRPRRSRPSPN